MRSCCPIQPLLSVLLSKLQPFAQKHPPTKCNTSRIRASQTLATCIYKAFFNPNAESSKHTHSHTKKSTGLSVQHKNASPLFSFARFSPPPRLPPSLSHSLSLPLTLSLLPSLSPSPSLWPGCLSDCMNNVLPFVMKGG